MTPSFAAAAVFAVVLLAVIVAYVTLTTFNAVVAHNTRIGQFPGVALAPLFGWRERPMFSADDSARERPAADLSPG